MSGAQKSKGTERAPNTADELERNDSFENEFGLGFLRKVA